MVGCARWLGEWLADSKTVVSGMHGHVAGGARRGRPKIEPPRRLWPGGALSPLGGQGEGSIPSSAKTCVRWKEVREGQEWPGAKAPVLRSY